MSLVALVAMAVATSAVVPAPSPLTVASAWPPLLAVSAATADMIWWASLGIFLVVLLVVAALLQLVLGSARRIESGVADIWTVGKLIARNTVQIATLERINQLAGGVVTAAGGIDGALESIADHAAECPGCPDCVTGSAGPTGPAGQGRQSWR